jgi:hypothetical protein
MTDDDDIAATLNALPGPNGSPTSDDDDIAKTMASLDSGSTKTSGSSVPRAQRIAMAESGGNPNAKNPNSTATGLGQFTDATWLPLIKKHRPDLAAGKTDQQLLDMRTNKDLSSDMIEAHAKDNEPLLAQNGVPPTDGAVYGAHVFGADGYSKIHNADPATPIESLIGARTAKINGMTGKTAGQVTQEMADKVASSEAPSMAVPAPTEAPEPLSWGDTIEQAGENLVPSTIEAAKGVGKAIIHPLDTAKTLKDIGVGLESKVAGWAGQDQDPVQKAKDEALVDALGQSYKQKYGTIDGFKQALAKDPASVLMDASTVLTGGGAAAKVGSLLGDATRVGDAIGAAGRVASTVGKTINPLNPAGIVTGAVKSLTAPAAALDDAGNVTPKIDALIKKVTNNTMSGADLVDPDVKEAFAASIKKKGISEASVKEALMRSQGLKAPTQVVTGAAAPLAAREATMAAIDDNNATLATRSANVASPASTSEIGEALDHAHTNSLNAASAAYDNIRGMPGSFGARMPELGNLGAAIKNTFDGSGIPTKNLTILSTAGYPQAAAAIKLIQNTWGNGSTLLRGDMNANEILSMRKALNNFRASAKGSDIIAVKKITDALDSHIKDLSSRGFFTDSRGNPVQGISQQIDAANAGYKAHFNTFDQSVNPAMRAAIKQLKDGQTFDSSGQRLPSGDTARYAAAQDGLTRQLLHPTKGSNTYNQLASALGGNTAPIDDFIKGSMMSGKNGAKIMASPVAAKAFASSPDDLSRARHIQALQDLNNAKPGPIKSSGLKSTLLRGGLKAGASALGYEHFGIPGAIIAPLAEHGIEKILDSRTAANASRGAPNASSIPVRAAKSVARNTLTPTGIAAAHYKDQAQQVSDSMIPRASGGKVDHEALVTRLLNKWKAAKKTTDATTKPLLNMPDAAIVRALDIAQEHI